MWPGSHRGFSPPRQRSSTYRRVPAAKYERRSTDVDRQEAALFTLSPRLRTSAAQPPSRLSCRSFPIPPVMIASVLLPCSPIHGVHPQHHRCVIVPTSLSVFYSEPAEVSKSSSILRAAAAAAASPATKAPPPRGSKNRSMTPYLVCRTVAQFTQFTHSHPLPSPAI
jgi:hypothetical protein